MRTIALAAGELQLTWSSLYSMGPNAARILLDWGVDLHESPQMTIVREFDQHHNLVSEKQLDPVGVWGAPWLLNVS